MLTILWKLYTVAAVYLAIQCSALTTDDFFSYGIEVGDTNFPANDDERTLLTSPISYVFFGTERTNLYVSVFRIDSTGGLTQLELLAPVT